MRFTTGRGVERSETPRQRTKTERDLCSLSSVTRQLPKEGERRKVVWTPRDETDEPVMCPHCGTPGTLAHDTPAAEYFACPRCERLWDRERTPERH